MACSTRCFTCDGVKSSHRGEKCQIIHRINSAQKISFILDSHWFDFYCTRGVLHPYISCSTVQSISYLCTHTPVCALGQHVPCVFMGDGSDEFMRSSINLSLMGWKRLRLRLQCTQSIRKDLAVCVWHGSSHTRPEYRGDRSYRSRYTHSVQTARIHTGMHAHRHRCKDSPLSTHTHTSHDWGCCQGSAWAHWLVASAHHRRNSPLGLAGSAKEAFQDVFSHPLLDLSLPSVLPHTAHPI